MLPPNMVIHRLTGDAPRELLIGPKWSLKKWEVLNAIDKELKERIYIKEYILNKYIYLGGFMKIDLIISADDIKKEKINDKSVVVVDMLRATSVITTAINNGVQAVIPVLTIEEALEIARNDREKYILGGERKAFKNRRI